MSNHIKFQSHCIYILFEHKFYFVLVAGDLRQKTPAGADNGYRNHRKFLDGRMGKRPHSCYCLNAE